MCQQIRRLNKRLVTCLRCYGVLAGLIGCTLFNISYGETVNNLYSTRVSVPNRSDSEHQAALATALAQVLTKISGNRMTKTDAMVVENTQNLTSYVQSYGYDALQEGASNQSLHVSFDQHALDQLVIQSGSALWDGDRPSVLLWLVVQTSNGKQYIVDRNDQLAPILEQVAESRGVPLTLPLMDAADQNTVSAEAIVANQDVLLSASTRYQADIIITATLKQVDSQAYQSLGFNLTQHTPISAWHQQADPLEVGAGSFIHRLSDDLANERALVINTETKHPVNIVVSNIDSLDTYNRLTRILTRLPLIDHISIESMENDLVKLTLTCLGSTTQLVQALAQHQSLGREMNPENDSTAMPILRYIWRQAT